MARNRSRIEKLEQKVEGSGWDISVNLLEPGEDFPRPSGTYQDKDGKRVRVFNVRPDPGDPEDYPFGGEK